MIWKALVRVEDGKTHEFLMKELGNHSIVYDYDYYIKEPPVATTFGGVWVGVEYDDEVES